MGRMASTPRTSAVWKVLLVAASVAMAATAAAAAAAAAAPGSGGCGYDQGHSSMTESEMPLTDTWAQAGPPGDEATQGAGAADPNPLMDADEDDTAGGAAALDLGERLSGDIIIPDSEQQDISTTVLKPGIGNALGAGVNKERTRIGLRKLFIWSILRCNAERHSRAMENAGKIFVADLRTIRKILCGRYVSQVLAKAKSSGSDSTDGANIVRLWMKNPTTRNLMLYRPLVYGGCAASVKNSYVYANCIFLHY